MKKLLFVPIVLSLAVLGAHFMRADVDIGVIGAAVVIGLLFVRKAWVARLVQVVLVLGTIEWLRTVVELIQARAAQGEPYTRLAIILAAVVVVTAGSALIFQTREMKRIYGLNGGDSAAE